jgi:hypothetical protein
VTSCGITKSSEHEADRGQNRRDFRGDQKQVPERLFAARRARTDGRAALLRGHHRRGGPAFSALRALQMRLQAQSGSLGKLSFSVRRQVDVAAWAAAGEQLLDLRKIGPFRLRGTLLAEAKTELEPAWRSGSAAEIAAAMLRFRQTHEEGLLKHIPEDLVGREARHAWGRRISAYGPSAA